MAIIHEPVNIDQVLTGEIRATFIGQPRNLARMTLRSGDLNVGMTVHAAWSARSVQALELLRKSLEADMVEVLTTPLSDPDEDYQAEMAALAAQIHDPHHPFKQDEAGWDEDEDGEGGGLRLGR